MTRPAAIVSILWLAMQPAAAPVPRPALDGVLDSLQANRLVAISDPHGSARMQAFIRELIAAPRFGELVDDLVLEIGNARHQALVDRYVAGEAVAERDLADAWLNTTVANQISADVEWFRRVRAINRTRPPARRMRILLGDPPIDWDAVRTREDHVAFLAQRDSFPAALIQTEVIARQRRALIIYGHLHFQRRNMMSNFDMDDWRAQTIVSLIERAGPTRVFTIWNLAEELTDAFPDAAAWPRPALADVRGTSLGRLDVARMYPKRPRMRLIEGKPVPVPPDEWLPLAIEQQLDAVLYLGPSAGEPRLAPSAEPCKRPGFLQERLRRIALTGIPRFEAEAIEKLCATPAK